MGRHPSAVWPDPQERRQLWALDRRAPEDAPLVMILPGDAPSIRASCRSGHLICPIGDCSDTRLTARGGPLRRDHFAHLSGGGHGPETIAHWAAKHLVGVWLRGQEGATDVHVDDISIETGQRPDVSARLLDGRRIAFEVQYAPLSFDTWRERHLRYSAAGIIDVWLWGRSERWLTGSGSPGRHRMARMLDGLLDEGSQIYWIDPASATILTPRFDGWPSLVQPFDLWSAELFDDVRLVDGKLVAPFDAEEARLRRQRARELAAAEAQAIAREAADRAADDVLRQRRSAYEAAQAERRAERDRRAELARERARRPSPELVDEWRQYSARNAWWLQHVWPVITIQTHEDGLIRFVPAYWHARVFEQFINGRVGSELATADVAGLLAAVSGTEGDIAYEVAVAYVGILTRMGYLGIGARSKAAGTFEVLADVETPAVPPDPPGPKSDSAPPTPPIDAQLALFELLG